MAAPNFPELEEKLLKEWEEKAIFKKTLEKPAPKGPFVFFEGPPTANGKPGIHHVLARAFKDLIPRFKTMQGYRVDRKAGWDTHGLPVELEVEKQLGLKNKKDVEAYGVEKFNEKCRESVWKYLDEWVKMTQRMGYWVDLEHPYVTYKNDYVESVWNIVSEIEKRGLLYKGHKIVPYCARCGTALSSHEVAQGYKEVEENTVYARFKVKGEKDTYFLAWTTTPWTLPSNTALAVGPEIAYVKAEKDGADYILAKDRLSVLGEAEIVEVMKGSDLVGMEYEPLYSFLPLSKPAHRVVPGSFVTTADGTGIVHMAPFGEDDMNVIKENDFPVLMTVGLDGAFIKEVTPWAGRFVKDADPDIIKDLESRGLLYKEEKYKHDYPFCWRCSTPLLYYPKDSWFIAMSKLQKELVANNEKINWEPAHIKEGRFGEWLRGIKDWAISRDRYWGTPLPIWECECGKTRTAGSFEEMNAKRFRKNRFFIVRHGRAMSNQNGYLSCWPEPAGLEVHLTPEGEASVRATAEMLKKEGVDLIFASDLKRTTQTAELIAEITGAELKFDERLRELNVGVFNGKSEEDYNKQFSSLGDKMTRAVEGGENLEEVRARMVAAVLEFDRNNQGKTIAIVSHGDPLWVLDCALGGVWDAGTLENYAARYPETGSGRELKVPNWPFDHKGLLDVHKPFIDAVTLECECGQEMKRTPEVMDVWFDSGAMPFAQWHYPFENKAKIDAGEAYPADFISEAIDQTRGWFYTLLAVSTLLGKEPAYKNVICLGHLLDSKGQKMSKSKGNVVNPWDMFAKYGADAVRFHLYTVNQPGDPKRFDEKEVDGVVKKLFLILWNVLSFWKMYVPAATSAEAGAHAPKHILDAWIFSELNAVTKNVTHGLEKFDVVTAGRAISDFANDLSTWYLRRSRDRFKNGTDEEKASAVATLGHCLLTVAKLMAPFTPHVAEGLYRELGGEKESIHLDTWPEAGGIDENLVLQMKHVRRACSLGLEKRAAGGLPVRQVLSKMTIKAEWTFEPWMLEIVAEEVNLKTATYEKGSELEVELDTTLTPELKREGAARELTRAVNALRKEAKLTIQDRITLLVDAPEGFWKEVMAEHGSSIMADVKADAVKESLDGALAAGETEADGQALKIGIIKG
ncbi:MAG TPA: class I tRNA ligase family protein [Candidatus Baltobacteraceae bacterium]|nr:class I tRNA ligase family protein [Candidatus Baltobacteraceae bacterium]